MSQNNQDIESTQPDINPEDVYEVMTSYYSMSIDPKGRPVEVKNANQKIQFYKLRRRNKEHSRLALDILNQKKDIMDVSMEFVRVCSVDDKIATDIMGDPLACMSILRSEAVQEDFDRFFGNWDLEKTNPA